MSVGRGTDKPFRIFGHPDYVTGSYIFTPRSIPGVSEHPPYEGNECFGADLSDLAENALKNRHHFTLNYLLTAQQVFPDTVKFFNPYFDKLSGNSMLRIQIEERLSEENIRASWQDDVEKFKATRKKYLLYTDFE
jgi:uncharacterized protein YbbC (DUF1343 family)